MKSSRGLGILAVCIALVVVVGGCATRAGTGALAGGGIGALAGQAIGHSTGATLIGAAVGTGVGYIVGNEMDKKKAQEMSQATKANNYDHSEVGPLGGTKWQVMSIAPKDRVPAFTSKIVEFGPRGHVTTTTTFPNGKVEVFKETYRVVGDTLIVNKPGYLINAKYAVKGNEMVVDAQDFSAVLTRLP
jgi:uncharacterized protein YcfJ